MARLKKIVLVSTLIAAVAALAACEKEITEPPLKFGGDKTSGETPSR